MMKMASTEAQDVWEDFHKTRLLQDQCTSSSARYPGKTFTSINLTWSGTIWLKHRQWTFREPVQILWSRYKQGHLINKPGYHRSEILLFAYEFGRKLVRQKLKLVDRGTRAQQFRGLVMSEIHRRRPRRYKWSPTISEIWDASGK